MVHQFFYEKNRRLIWLSYLFPKTEAKYEIRIAIEGEAIYIYIYIKQFEVLIKGSLCLLDIAFQVFSSYYFFKYVYQLSSKLF